MFADNFKSPRDNPEFLRDKVGEGSRPGAYSWPVSSSSPLPYQNLRVSPLGVVPKKEAGKFCLINHLSYPMGMSVNDGISKEEASA